MGIERYLKWITEFLLLIPLCTYVAIRGSKKYEYYMWEVTIWWKYWKWSVIVSMLFVVGKFFTIVSMLGLYVNVLPNSFMEVAGGIPLVLWYFGLLNAGIIALGAVLRGGHGWREFKKTGLIGGLILSFETFLFYYFTVYAVSTLLFGIEDVLDRR